jgi:hypothetical protein
VPALSSSLNQYSNLFQETPLLVQAGFLAIPEIEPAVFEIINSLHLISAAIASVEAGQVDRRTISNTVYTVEHRLLSLRSDATSKDDEDKKLGQLDLSRALLLAAHLYLHLAIRDLPGTAKMHLNIMKMLQSVIQPSLSSYLSSTSTLNLTVLLWTLFIGAIAAQHRPDRAIFVQHLRLVSSVMGISSRTEFEGRLKGVLWLEKFCDAHCGRVWDEMGVHIYMDINLLPDGQE